MRVGLAFGTVFGTNAVDKANNTLGGKINIAPIEPKYTMNTKTYLKIRISYLEDDIKRAESGEKKVTPEQLKKMKEELEGMKNYLQKLLDEEKKSKFA